MSSSNNQISIIDLPRVKDISLTPLPKRAIYLGVINLTVFFILLVTLFSILVILGVDVLVEYGRYAYVGLLVLYLLLLGYHILGFRYKKYALRQHDIVHQDGFLWRSLTAVPFNRIQHCEVTQGPLHRIMNVSQLKVFTAGGSSSDLSISGLPSEEAHKMKQFILAKTALDEEE